MTQIDTFPPEDAVSKPQPVEVDFARLSSAALGALVEAFIHREGTDYGLHEVSLADKKAQVMRQLHNGDVKIYFDLEHESCTLVPNR